MNREQRKRANKQATARPVQETNALTDGTDRQINEVRTNSVRRDGSQSMTAELPLVSSSEPSSGSSAAPTGWVNQRASEALSDAKGFTDSRLGNYYTKSQVYTQSQTNSEINNAVPSYSGYALNDTSNEHRHSVSSTTFIQRTKEERQEMLEDRTRLEGLIESGTLNHAEEVLARNTWNLLTLLQDYRDLHAYERERRFDDPAYAEWTQVYKTVYGVDEYAEEAVGDFVSHHGTKMHPYEGIAPAGGA